MKSQRRSSAVLALIALASGGCGDDTPPASTVYWPIRFADVTADSGVDFVDHHGRPADEKQHIIETMGGGVALIDYDGDDDLDLFFADGDPGDGGGPRPSRLYQNLGDFRFDDVSHTTGADIRADATGVAVGDIDNDGRDDLFVAAYGPNVLLHNVGGRFEDISAAAGVDDDSYASSAAFADFDGDGDLDLFVCTYIVWDNAAIALSLKGGTFRGHPVIAGPRGFRGGQDLLFKNLWIETGERRFEDATAAAGLVPSDSFALGVVAADFDDDGDVDLYVANDSEANSLFVNDGSMNFTSTGAQSGAAYNADGVAQAGMGVDAGDVDGDGLPDLFVTNFSHDHYTLYRNYGDGLLEDRTRAFGLFTPTFLPLGFGCVFIDADLDGDLDIAAGNGHVFPMIDALPLESTYAQRNQMFRNDGPAFVEVSDPWPADDPGVTRGAARGDLDGDGAEDLVFTNLNGKPQILRNARGPIRSGSIVLRLIGRDHRPAVGARVEAVLSGGVRTIVRQVVGGGSYQSASSRDIVIGAGQNVSIRWPSGATQTLRDLTSGYRYTVQEGAGALQKIIRFSVDPRDKER